VIAAVIDGTYKTKFGGDVDTIHLAVGRAARFTSSGGLTRDAQAEMTDRAFRTAMVISTGTRLDDHGPQQATMAPTAAELRTAGQIGPEALSHVARAGLHEGAYPAHHARQGLQLDLRFVGKTRAQIRLMDPDSEVELIQLGVAITQPHFPALGLSAFGADSAAHWIVGGRDGLVFDGDAILAASPGAPPLPLGAP
jgi:hypothetical protein